MWLMNNDLQNEIERRRTFAIISHPDAGKTTMTEKLLLFGGAIQVFKQIDIGVEMVIVRDVGVLQLEVLEDRLLKKYNVELSIQRLNITRSRWIIESQNAISDLNITSSTLKAQIKVLNLMISLLDTFIDFDVVIT